MKKDIEMGHNYVVRKMTKNNWKLFPDNSEYDIKYCSIKIYKQEQPNNKKYQR